MTEISSEELDDLLVQYGAATEVYWFYNHTVQLMFKKDTWTYYLVESDGSLSAQSGVTSTTHRACDKSEPLMAWAKKRAMEKLKRLVLDQHVSPDGLIQLYEEELDQIIRDAKKADKEEMDAASETGHIAHAWLEKWVKACLGQGDKDYLLDHMPEDPRAHSCCRAGLHWMVAHDVKWICTERKVYSRKHRVAGTTDGTALVSSCGDPSCCTEFFKDRLSLIDWKTSNALYVEYLLQAGFYQCGIEEEDGVEIQDRWILRLDKETAEFDPWFAPGREAYKQDLDAFLKTLDMIRAVSVVEDRLADIKGVRKAARIAKEKAEREARDKIACPKSAEYKGSRLSKCLPDGSQCLTCAARYAEKHKK